MMKELSAIEVRILGSLMEKELTTPEQYPLTLNALTNACNQKSNRCPTVNYDMNEVKAAVEGLCSKTLAIGSDIPGSRVRKFRHFFTDRFKFVPAEAAILCELLIRGPQTVGELRSHASRMHPFPELADVERHLANLMDVSPPWVCLLPRQPGKKEQRYMHLLMGEPDLAELAEWEEERGSSATPSAAAAALPGRVGQLEAEVVALRQELQVLQQAFQQFRSQFE
ncbi:MAG: YceH family protein [Magnetococcales bacterium]|nr:YceH family protein [Magnetococcales bacterium]